MSNTRELPPIPPPPRGDGFRPVCTACRYDLSGSPDGACPECGRAFIRADLRLRSTPGLADFKPECPDCKYDLSGSPDGRCPECGLRFTHEGLQRRWIARKQARSEQARHLGVGLLFVFLSVGTISLMMSSAIGFALTLGFWTAVAAAWCYWKREQVMARSQYFLAFLLPLILMMPALAVMPYGLVACGVLGALCCVAGWLALRGAPLLSAAMLVIGVILPLLALSGVVFLAASDDLRAGRYWSSFNQPTPYGWQASPAYLSLRASYGMAGVAAAIVVVVSFYTRRAFVRLRARSGPARPASPAQP